MWCVIELQGYANTATKCLPKEIVICSNNHLSQFVVKPPQKLCDFSQKDRCLINWATNYYHNIPWATGELLLNDLPLVLSKETSTYSQIFTKGREKAAYLSQLLNRPVEDLSAFGCPSIRKSAHEKPCEIHFKQTAHCALVNAKTLQQWIAKHLKTPCTD
jgi:hypothetical protein